VGFSTIFGVLFFLIFQSSLVLDSGVSSRRYDEEFELNPVGLAYVHGLLFLINFTLFKSQFSKTLIIKFVLVLAQFLTIIAIFVTLSRGALIYLLFILVFIFLTKFKFNNKLILSFGKIMLLFFLLTSLFFLLSNFFPIILDKVSDLGNRFDNLFTFKGHTRTLDSSSQARWRFYVVFYQELNDFIIFGKKNYSPYPHNQFIEIIMRWGLIGIFLLVFSIFNFFKSFRILKYYSIYNHSFIFLILMLFIFSYLQSMTSLSLEMNRFLWLGFGFIFGFPLNKNYK